MRAHALEAGAFVLSACGYMTSAAVPSEFPLAEALNIGYAHGGSSIISPLGIPLLPPTSGDGILYAVCRAEMIKVWKAIIDTTGHYSRPDILGLTYQPTPYQGLGTAAERRGRDEIERSAEKYDVSPAAIEAAMEQVIKKE